MENTQRAALFRFIALAGLFSLAWAGLDTCPGVFQCRAECPAGFGISKANPKLCIPCGAGTFKKSSGNRECALCSAGSYASKTGSTSCTKCPAGSFADEKGSRTCKKCAPGTYSSAEGATECKVCDWKVSLKRYEGMTKCDLCPDSWYSLGSDKCHLRIGCFNDDFPRDLPIQKIFSTDNTPLRCSEYCKSKGFSYAGVQSQKDCFCGNSYSKYRKVKDSECSLKCTGDSRLTCGHESKNEIYHTGLLTRLGCFKDENQRDLPIEKVFSADNTPLRCAEYCKSKGYFYAGVQSNDECFCGNSYGKYGKLKDSECTLKCTGDSTQTCGDHLKSEIYFSGLTAHLGCFKDENQRDLPVEKVFSADNTPLRCAEYCKSKGYFYAGVQSNDECFCGNSYGKYGKLKDSECTLKCTGDGTRTCGDHWKSEIYFSGLTDVSRLGCFKDDGSRDLPHLVKFENDNTPLKCAEYCRSKGYFYAGVQGNAYCLCGNSYGKYGQLSDSECNFECTGDKSQKCGGSMKNDVYFSGIKRQ